MYKRQEDVGEAAFYGPKVDINAKNVYGKEDTMITIQWDALDVYKRQDQCIFEKFCISEYTFVIFYF